MKISQSRYGECLEALQHGRLLKHGDTDGDEANEKRLEAEEFTSVLYRSVVGSMVYIMMEMRPDTAFSVGYLRKFTENPSTVGWKAVQRVPRHPHVTKGIGLVYKKNGSQDLVGYSDSGGAISEDRNSISAQVSVFRYCLLCSSHKKQAKIALSTAEAETIALCEANKEDVSLVKLLLGLSVTPEGCAMKVDKQGALAIGKNQGSYRRTKTLMHQAPLYARVDRERKDGP